MLSYRFRFIQGRIITSTYALITLLLSGKDFKFYLLFINFPVDDEIHAGTSSPAFYALLL